MEIDIKDNVVLVTGASRGIGRELARKFAYEGTSVIINYRNNKEAADSLINEISQFNSKCSLFKADVTDKEDVKEMSSFIMKKYGKLDVLINNAGVCNDNRIQLMKLEQWNDIINVNLTGPFLCSKYFSKIMIRQGCGKIINIASLKGQEGCVGQANYSASKNGLIGLTKALAKELGGYNIAVNAICPGFIVTDLNRHNQEKLEIAKNRSVLDIQYSLSDMTSFIIWLSSDYCNGISGQVFNLDSRIN